MRTAVLIFLVLFMATGCGKKGALYLPDPEPAPPTQAPHQP